MTFYSSIPPQTVEFAPLLNRDAVPPTKGIGRTVLAVSAGITIGVLAIAAVVRGGGFASAMLGTAPNLHPGGGQGQGQAFNATCIMGDKAVYLFDPSSEQYLSVDGPGASAWIDATKLFDFVDHDKTHHAYLGPGIYSLRSHAKLPCSGDSRCPRQKYVSRQGPGSEGGPPWDGEGERWEIINDVHGKVKLCSDYWGGCKTPTDGLTDRSSATAWEIRMPCLHDADCVASILGPQSSCDYRTSNVEHSDGAMSGVTPDLGSQTTGVCVAHMM